MNTLKDRMTGFMPKINWDPKPSRATKMESIRVACVSDTHNGHYDIPEGIPECDILIHAGDISNRGKISQLAKFNTWGEGFYQLPKSNKICIAGNHDITFQHKRGKAEAAIPAWTYLQDETVELFGLKIHGVPWSPAYYPEDWAFQLMRGKQAAAHWATIPEDTDILIVHGPPYGYGDRIEARYGHGFQHVGCIDLESRLREVRPMLTVCGHIHQDNGIFAAPWGTVVNASIAGSAVDSNSSKAQVVTLRVPAER